MNFYLYKKNKGIGKKVLQELLFSGRTLKVNNLRRIKVLLIYLFILGGSLNLSRPVQANTRELITPSSLTEEQYQIYRNFYDSLNSVFEIAGSEMTLSLEEFENLPINIQTSVCLIAVDYSLFHSVITSAFRKTFGKKVKAFLLIKIVADLLNIEWNLSTKLNPTDEERIFQLGSSITDVKGIRLDALIEKVQFCFKNRMVERAAIPFQLVEKYNSVPIEFQLRDLYSSSIPLIQWILENIPPSEKEKEELQILFESLKSKYFIKV